MSESETILVDGMFFNKKHENAPDYVIGSVSFKVSEIIPFLEKHKKDDGYVNVDFLKSKAGKPYFKLNTWTKPTEDTATPPDDDVAIPF